MLRCTLPLTLALIGCTSGAPEPVEPAATTEPVRWTGACAEQVATYLAVRDRLSRCETDYDCAEMWPGLCPYGPYYIHREADIEPVLALEREIMTDCTIPECEPPGELGIAHCEEGRCARGREPKREPLPKGIRYMSCWDYRETWLEAEGSVTAVASNRISGVTPLVAISPASPGVLTLELDWPATCTDCRLLIWDTSPASPIEPVATRIDAKRERLEFPVTPGPHWFIGMAGTDTNYTVRADLRDREGQPGRVTRHGIGWGHQCEG